MMLTSRLRRLCLWCVAFRCLDAPRCFFRVPGSFDKAALEAKSAKELARLAAARIIYTAVVAAHAKAVGSCALQQRGRSYLGILGKYLYLH